MAEALTKQQIEEKVLKVVCSQLDAEPQEVNSGSRFVDDLGADSLDLTELAIAFEDEFEIEIPDADFGQLSTVANVFSYIEKRLKHA